MKGRILVVDDEEVTRLSLAETLRLEKYQVSTVGSGQAALDLLNGDNYDLVVLDLNMPDMGGIEVMRAARQLAPETQIILLASNGSLESAIEAMHNDVYDYILKPVETGDLLESISKGLARRAELRRRRLLLHQIESSIQQLKGVESVLSPKTVDQRSIPLAAGVMIDLARRELWRGNDRVSLTPTEGVLMRVLLENRGRVLTHRELVSLVQGYETTDFEAPEVLRPLVSRLRRKLMVFGGDGWIVNVRGTGYVFQEEGKSRRAEENTDP
jgi:DNA-binding response OmpR family regulator